MDMIPFLLHPPHNMHHVNLTGILTPLDEFQYWAETAMSGGSSARERAQHFQELFQPMSKEWGGLDSMPLLEALELVEVSQDTLDDLWKQTEHDPPYPESRMAHLMDIIGKLHFFFFFFTLALLSLHLFSGAVLRKIFSQEM